MTEYKARIEREEKEFIVFDEGDLRRLGKAIEKAMAEPTRPRRTREEPTRDETRDTPRRERG